MARRAEHYTQVGSGENVRSVGYSAAKRGEYLGVRFTGPNGERFEKITDCKKEDANFHAEAKKLIVKEFAPTYPNAKTVTWEDAVKAIPTTREDTWIAYTKAVRLMRATLAGHNVKPQSPSGITPEIAAQFSGFWLAGTYKRGKASDAKTYKRKPSTLNFYLRQLSAVWEHWLPLGYVKANPWKLVKKQKTDEDVKHVPTEDETGKFFAYVKTRYPEWERLHALLELKAFSSCRTFDICELRADQLQEGRVVWTAANVKQRKWRSVLVPDELFKTLKRLAGPVYLWEHFTDDMRKFRKSRNRKSEGFTPETVANVIGNIFREYSDTHTDRPRISPQALRRRGITLTATATQSVDATAQAIGITPACARAHYLNAQRAFNTDELFKKLSGVLMPKDAQAEDRVSPQIPRKSENNEAQNGTTKNNQTDTNA